MHPPIRKELDTVERRWPPLPQAPVVPRRLATTIMEFASRAENRDGRGLTVASRRLCVRTLKHISVGREAGREAASVELGRKACKLLKSLSHNSDFSETAAQARTFAGELQKAGRRNAIRRPVCDAEVHACGTNLGVGAVRLIRIVCVAELMAVGRMLNLCVAHADDVGRGYHAELLALMERSRALYDAFVGGCEQAHTQAQQGTER